MQDILNELIKTLVVTSIGALAPLVVAAVVQIFRKLSIDLSEAQKAQVAGVVQNVLVEVEEWASHRIKAQIPVTSGQKLSRAVEALLNKVPGIDEAEAEILVRQELPKIGMGAVSFLAETAQAATSNQSHP